MPPSSSGGTTVGEALNIMEELEPSGLDELLHGYLEATAVAFADRGKYLGDPAYTPVPRRRLLDQTFAAERACGIDMSTTSAPMIRATSSRTTACATRPARRQVSGGGTPRTGRPRT